MGVTVGVIAAVGIVVSVAVGVMDAAGGDVGVIAGDDEGMAGCEVADSGETPQPASSIPNEAPPPSLTKSRRERSLRLRIDSVMASLQGSRRMARVQSGLEGGGQPAKPPAGASRYALLPGWTDRLTADHSRSAIIRLICRPSWLVPHRMHMAGLTAVRGAACYDRQ